MYKIELCVCLLSLLEIENEAIVIVIIIETTTMSTVGTSPPLATTTSFINIGGKSNVLIASRVNRGKSTRVATDATRRVVSFVYPILIIKQQRRKS